MSPSDFFYLAAGLLLGVASGAAFVEVLRARPASRREVRVTVTQASGTGRASTLATPLQPRELIQGRDDLFGSSADRPEHPFGREGQPATSDGAPGEFQLAGMGPGTQRAEAAADPCAGPRTTAADACNHADRMATLAAAAQERLREAKRAYDEHVTRRERAAAAMDPRAVRAAKDEAQARFRRARLAARERFALEAAAREWLREINRVNARSRDAAAVAAREGTLEGGLLRDLERKGMEADGARITAEHAAESCRAARIALADCEEFERVGRPNLADGRPAGSAAAAPDAGMAPDEAGGEGPAAAASARLATPTRAGATPPAAADDAAGGTATPRGAPDAEAPLTTSLPVDFAGAATAPGQLAGGPIPADVPGGPARPAPMAAAGPRRPSPPMVRAEDDELTRQGSQDVAILRLLRGDRASLRALVSRLAGDDEGEQRRWTLLLSDLVDAILARAIDATALVFPEGHPFWGGHSQGQSRDIAAAMAALGFRFDGLGGWVDGRIPGQRDLSLALGYAGLDPMRVRRWPTEKEMGTLFRDVRVDAGRYLAEAAGGLTMGEMVDLLGRRAEPLADLWNAWGRVRPLLLDTL